MVSYNIISFVMKSVISAKFVAGQAAT